MTERLQKFFGKDYIKKERVFLYDYIENFINTHVDDWTKTPDTDAISRDFFSAIKELDDSDFSFLLLTTGYIPEFYVHDSSQETLYSKLVEVLVCEWAIRIVYTDSNIVKQKSSKEDVSIKLGNLIIVCDAKTYRLGRSQAAPNVKDTIKKADYDKWQSAYRGQPYNDEIVFAPIGGLITFPSLHRWKGSSDAYLYCTDKDDPICILFYEYLAYMILGGYDHSRITNVLTNYGELFPSKTKEQHTYFKTILGRMFGEGNETFNDFIKLSLELTNELVAHKIELVTNFVEEYRKTVEAEVDLIRIEDLKARLIEAETKLLSSQLNKQLHNITKFRVEKGAEKKNGSGSVDKDDNEDGG
jgi:hypothetical protein